jgi:hypothetical protein
MKPFLSFMITIECVTMRFILKELNINIKAEITLNV